MGLTATHASVPAPAQTKAKKSRLRQRLAREAKAADDDAREATWAHLLRLEREARAAADAARAASGGGVDMGHGEESEESEEEYDAWRTYYEIFDNNFDYDLKIIVDYVVLLIGEIASAPFLS